MTQKQTQTETIQIGIVNVFRTIEGGFTITFESPFVRKGWLIPKPVEKAMVAENLKSLRKKMSEIADFFVKAADKEIVAPPTLIEASDYKDEETS